MIFVDFVNRKVHDENEPSIYTYKRIMILGVYFQRCQSNDTSKGNYIALTAEAYKSLKRHRIFGHRNIDATFGLLHDSFKDVGFISRYDIDVLRKNKYLCFNRNYLDSCFVDLTECVVYRYLAGDEYVNLLGVQFRCVFVEDCLRMCPGFRIREDRMQLLRQYYATHGNDPVSVLSVLLSKTIAFESKLYNRMLNGIIWKIPSAAPECSASHGSGEECNIDIADGEIVFTPSEQCNTEIVDGEVAAEFDEECNFDIVDGEFVFTSSEAV
ncbi:hypothetical protein GUITHDRAFT_146934 [Guillardia theta CCMP2712]|uniref:Uncharacterized protein n=1 Tax=Guillardia theta (strain CCMP2712) TaxID=905079 RepID=L1IG03_GUITC|nr:hypothetical protein GUITHDRAFT_146934 [Guillardia theta CCMP2712]EKX34824.1 hypothetical protein GUITHDRAFT_146934 [Guillardia theta CCMP2712]|eukprot:XP_005821804.1 hypothetical protein GUITHDRAFT_146934 [Guillardia theta CCMP2712]